MVLLAIGLLVALCWIVIWLSIRFWEWATQKSAPFSPQRLIMGVSPTLRHFKHVLLKVITRHERIRSLVKGVLLGSMLALCMVGIVLMMLAMSDEARLLR